MQMFSSLQDYGVRTRLQDLWREVNGIAAETDEDFQSNQQKGSFALARTYKDILYPNYLYAARYQTRATISSVQRLLY